MKIEKNQLIHENENLEYELRNEINGLKVENNNLKTRINIISRTFNDMQARI